MQQIKRLAAAIKYKVLDAIYWIKTALRRL